MNCSTHIFSIMLGRLWTKGRTSQYSGRSLTSRSLKSRSSHIGSYSLQSPLLFVSCLDEPKWLSLHKQINEHKDRPVAVNKSFCHLAFVLMRPQHIGHENRTMRRKCAVRFVDDLGVQIHFRRETFSCTILPEYFVVAACRLPLCCAHGNI